mmetsp:Transcript_20605/g.49057  ORF Transcript_20605/g.49057 Transcript_20605/m.49057 type:complete len:83 (+) Transcript_20605:255-503(+)
MFITVLFNIPIIYFIGRSSKIAWDYAITMSLCHLILTCIVTTSFPQNWAWWLTLILETIVVIVGSELSCYYLRDLKEFDTGR